MTKRTIRRTAKPASRFTRARPARSARRAHPLVDQLRFTRSEWLRALRGVSDESGARHFGRMNSIGWIVGHLAWQEQRYLLHRPQGIMLRDDIQRDFTTGGPMSTPSLVATLAAWRSITKAADPFLDQLTTKKLLVDLPLNGKRSGQTQGSAIRRMTYHYWFHIGEILAIRQQLGEKRLPEYVGSIEAKAPYRPEQD
ncbi:MAG TPA: DinB family protein [Methylomirabilota bacterium]|nr:DinB family protein [Methylomirabilota bacterium]